MLRATPQAVRRLAIRNQRLEGPAPRRKPTAQDLLETVRALRCLQLDPTAVVARNHLLVLFSRHGAFDERAFEQLAYEDRALFEYWAHEASYVLSEDLPIHRFAMHEPRYRGHRTWWDGEPEFRAHILERLREEGPLRAREIEDKATVGWESTGGWTNGRTVARMLDMLWVAGQTGISRRDGTQRVWDLMERCWPPDAPREELDPLEVQRRAVVHAIRALGAARPPHIRKHFTRFRYPDLPIVLAELHAAGVIEPLAVDGLGEDWWVLSEDVEALQNVDDFKPRTVLLSPFDNLLCDRARTEALFGFHHRLEIYVPKPKRRWGYFVLPILDGDRLVGRADLAMDRKRGVLVAHAVHAEPKVPRGARLPKAIRRELERLAAWRGASDVEVRSTPDIWPL
ncbi:winged helix DNA-binding domain-containing protein [Solirubrobacter phytolaccae]|uniref:Winged helix DNA-binding domain-containing protein n=1 Tax=Solirubrobacter phytolaccae TaxID=1404360 RepID=A0A9X3N6M5_9ACTN|nr:crosslink repair DNA glycosylase YcaQ family protein [Solirubrobacter phytolaccae]MDA0180451.1 winged helix DNA-binding domain-containing protein [Solirubrobacter phytolaccae]